jgi:cyclopropane fatty-acyl-phospholipid synthase-like methyltransferase
MLCSSAMIERVRSVLSFSWAYQAFWQAIGGDRRNRILVRDFICPSPGDCILDIGCGPGTMVPYLPPADYVGFDASEEYIGRAKRRFPEAQFICQKVSQHNVAKREYFDIVLALGILHHLDDAEAATLFQIAHTAMKPGGRLVTIDGVWTEHQSPIAKYLLARDRGRFVRSEAGYRKLAADIFSNVECSVLHDLLRVPYSLMIMKCSR